MAPVNGRPFLSYLLNQLIQAGIGQAILCTGYKGNQIRDTYGERYEELSIRYSQESEPLGTGGALHYALPLIATDWVLAMNGDSFLDTDLNSATDWFFQKQAEACLLLKEFEDTSRYGRVTMDKEGLILCFEEKSADGDRGLINAGVYILRTPLLATIPSGERYSLERDWFPALSGKRQLYGYVCEGEFIDIGTPESYAQAEGFFSGADR